MQKNASSYTQGSCPFCHSPSQEIKIILKGVFTQLSRMLKKHKTLEGELQRGDCVSFHRILRVLFERHQFELKLSQGCAHQNLRILFREKLHCPQQQLDSLLEKLCDQLARRNYELEIVAAQIKNVQQSVVDLQEKIELDSEKTEKRQSTAMGEVKVEEIERVELRPSQEGSEHIVQDYSGIPGMPYPYNILYYGNYYCTE